MSFFIQFLKHPVLTGSAVPSSKELAELITDIPSLHKKNCIVELGPGSGIFTGEILKKLSTESCFICLEINPTFVSKIEDNYPGVNVYHASAKDIKKYLLKHNKMSTDCIVSALPWAGFNQQLQTEILDEIYDALEVGGEFLTIALLQGTFFPPGIKFKQMLKEKFRTVEKSKILWRNFPPAFIYHCIK